MPLFQQFYTQFPWASENTLNVASKIKRGTTHVHEILGLYDGAYDSCDSLLFVAVYFCIHVPKEPAAFIF
jgi:hypothetical protein